MEVIPVGDVFEAIVRRRGFDPDLLVFDETDRANLSELVNRAVKRVWESKFWEPLMVVEQRHYREDWDSGINYAAGEEVWRESAYYASVVDGNVGNDPDLDGAGDYWSAAGGDFLATLSLDPVSGEKIGALDVRKHVFSHDPRNYPGNAPLDGCVMSGEFIVVRAPSVPAAPWIKYRLPTRRYTWVEWDVAVAYAVGDLVYVKTSDGDSVKETFVAKESSTGSDPYQAIDKWDSVEFPLFMRDYVVEAVVAMEMAEDEGRYKAKAAAKEELDWMHDRYGDQVGAPRRARWKVSR